MDVPEDAIDKFGLLFFSSDCSNESWFACEIAKYYRKETYMRNAGDQFDSPEKVIKCVSISFDLANDPSDYIIMIENVAQENSGLHLGDKIWGREILEQVKSKVDNKTFKRAERSVESALF